MFLEIYTYLQREGMLCYGFVFNLHPVLYRERVESLILSIQISTNVQNRIMLTEPVSLFINIGMVCILLW